MTMDAFSSHVPIETASEFITYRSVILKSRSCVCKSLLYMSHFALVFCSRGNHLHLDMTCFCRASPWHVACTGSPRRAHSGAWNFGERFLIADSIIYAWWLNKNRILFDHKGTQLKATSCWNFGWWYSCPHISFNMKCFLVLGTSSDETWDV